MNWKDMAHPNAGGAEVYTYEITKAWANQGHAVTWFCAAVSGRPGKEVIDGVTIVRRGSRFGVYAAAKKWFLAQAPESFDLVIDEVNTRPFLAVKYVRGIPVVALIHQVCREIWWQEMPLPIAAFGRFYLEGRWLRSYEACPVLTVSESSRKSLSGYGLTNIAIVPEGVGPMKRPDVSKEAVPTLIFVGRLASNKRPADAIEAFALLTKRLPGARMWVVGDGPQRHKLEKGAPAGVTFFGRVDEDTKHSLMARAHALVVTSVREGWGLVVDEAAAMGTISIAYDVPGLRDSTSAARGLLVPAMPTALAAALETSLPELLVKPETTGWAGGAIGWADVAADVLQRAIPTTASA